MLLTPTLHRSGQRRRLLALSLGAGLACTAVLPLAAQAATLLDTGTPNGSLAASLIDSSNHLALQFNAGGAWAISDVAAYLSGGQPGDEVAIVLYAEGANHLPADQLASTTVAFAADGWAGATGLGWQLASAGRYWLALEGVSGYVTAPAGGLQMPGDTAFADGSAQGAYQAYPGLQFGLTVSGAVPEPASLALLLAGLGAVLGQQRLRRPQRASAA